MTTIVWDGQRLYADTQITQEGAPKVNAKKLLVTEDGFLVGMAGVLKDCRRLLLWFRRGANPAKVPEDLQASLLVVTPVGRLLTVDSDGTVCELLDHRFAIGSGAQYALGAMAMDASGPEAIEVAMSFDPATGGRVVSVGFEGSDL